MNNSDVMTSPNTEILSVEDEVLTRCIDQHLVVTVYTINGFQMRGYVLGHDEYVIRFQTEDDNKEKMIYKSAISTIGLPKTVNTQ